MIDIHTHIIYEIDDGASSLEEAKSMIEMAMKSGTKRMIATSHYIPDTYKYSKETYLERFEVLNEWVKSKKLDMILYVGNEVYLDSDGLEGLRDKKCFTINNGKYVLVELTNFVKLDKLNEMLGLVDSLGYKAVIAHIERVRWVLEDIEVIKKWHIQGFVFQMNASSLLKRKYKDDYKSAHKLLKEGLVHIIASDGHRVNFRKPEIREAYEYVQNTLGERAAKLLFEENPQGLLDDLKLSSLREKKMHKCYTFKRIFKFKRR